MHAPPGAARWRPSGASQRAVTAAVARPIEHAHAALPAPAGGADGALVGALGPARLPRGHQAEQTAPAERPQRAPDITSRHRAVRAEGHHNRGRERARPAAGGEHAEAFGDRPADAGVHLEA